MEQIINITLGGRNIAIEEAAYQKVKAYTNSLLEYYKNEEGRDEIVADIEARFGELMHDKIRKGAPYITDADVEALIAAMGRPEDFDTAAQDSEKGYRPNFTVNEKRRLYRDSNNKVIGGVCSGIAHWLNLDPTIVRVLFAIVTFGGFGSGILIYIALWIFLPLHGIDEYKGKRMFRDPDNKWFGGVAGGMGAYFNINPNTIRGIMALPLLISILKGVNVFGWNDGFHFFPNLIFSGLTGTFIFIYIVLWIVLPEALTSYQKMEMRGQHIDVNTIKQNVQSTMGDLGERMKNWSKEVQESAEKLGKRAETFGQTRGKQFGREFSHVAQRSSKGIGYVFAMIFKAIFIIIGGIIAVSLLAVFLTFLFSGFVWAPINNFLWTSETQQFLGSGTLILFIGAPIVGLVVWLIRRVLNVRTPGNYLSWSFGGLWAMGWICLMFFIASISNDVKRYEVVEEPITISQPVGNKMILKVSQPELRYEGNFGWISDNNNNEWRGFNFTVDSLMLSTVNLDFDKSDDSLYHVTIIKQAMGKSDDDAIARAKKIQYAVTAADSILDLPAGFVVDKNSKYRLQNVLVLVQVPVGKKINIDESVNTKLNDIEIDFNNGRRRIRNARYPSHRIGAYLPNTDYTMQSDGSLKSENSSQVIEKKKSTDDNYRWESNAVDTSLPLSSSIDTAEVYHYNQSPTHDNDKNKVQPTLEQKQKEVDSLRRKLLELQKELLQ